MHLAVLFLAIIVSPLFVFSSQIEQIGSNQNDPDAAKLRISQLGTQTTYSLFFFFFFVFVANCIKLLDGSDHVEEAVLEETTQKVKEREGLIQDAESQILDFHSASSSFEVGLVIIS